MAWLLAHMWIALALAALAGFLIGWALRDRRQTEGSADQHTHSTTDFSRLQSENKTLNAHLVAAKETAETAAASNASAEAKLANLRAELDATKEELAALKQDAKGAGAAAGGAASLAAVAVTAAPAKSDKLYIDDIVLVSGIGDATAKKLQALDVQRVSQLAAMSDAQLTELEKKIGLPEGRIAALAWREQAQELARGEPPRAKVDYVLWEKLLAEGKGIPVETIIAQTDSSSGKLYIDDIVLVGGIGDATARKMKALGITQISQIAAMNDDELTELETRLGLISGRTSKEAWREQAQDLIEGKPPRAKVDIALWEKLLAQGKGKPVP